MNNALVKKIFFSADKNSHACLFCHPNKGMVIFSTKHFNLLRPNYPASKGHLMISSKRHFGCAGELDKSLLPELTAFKVKIERWYKKRGYLCYEHGRAGACHGGEDRTLNCEHFHFNFIESNICLHNDVLKAHPQCISVGMLSEIIDLFNRWGEYLYVENSKNQKYFYPVYKQDVESHFLRSLVCKNMNQPQKGDWCQHKNYDDFFENVCYTNDILNHL